MNTCIYSYQKCDKEKNYSLRKGDRSILQGDLLGYKGALFESVMADMLGNDQALKLGAYNIGRKDELLTLPMYMGYLLTDR